MSARTVTGKATGVGQANSFGFANVKIETSSGTTEWAATKVAGIIGEARRAKEAGEVRSFDLTDVVNPAGKINPQTGQPYVNTYIEAIRPPAQEEVNGNVQAATEVAFDQGGLGPLYTADPTQVVPGVNAQTVPDSVPTSRATGGATTVNVPPPSQDEFRRSKEEMRWTEALHIAATLAPTVGAKTYENFKTLAWNIEALIQEKS